MQESTDNASAINPPPPPPPPSPEGANKQTSVSVENTEVKYSSKVMRMAAATFDSILVSVVAFLIFLPIGETNGYNFVSGVLSVIYSVVSLKSFSKTFGKHLFGLKVVKEDGESLSWMNILIRETVGKLLSAIVIGIGYLWILFDSKRQGWHDKLAKTVVIQEVEPGKGKKILAYIIAFLLPALAILGIIASIILVAINPNKVLEEARKAKEENNYILPTNPPNFQPTQ